MIYIHRGEYPAVVDAYDRLYPFIRDNRELAGVLGEYIPWIETPNDALRFYDTYILQFAADQIMS